MAGIACRGSSTQDHGRHRSSRGHAGLEAQIGEDRTVAAGPGPNGRLPDLLFCENETNVTRVFGGAPGTPYPKDGINDHVVSRAATVNPEQRGTKMACRYGIEVPAAELVELRLRLTREDNTGAADLGKGFAQVFAARMREADEYYETLRLPGASDEESAIMRQAFAGMIWSQQFYHYRVVRWLEGDPAQPAPPAARLGGRNKAWKHLNSHDVLAMPDKWEYPWFASWDLAFHCVVLAHIDPSAAKHQLLLMFREWYMHPSGKLPAYEWDFSDVNPPVHAWAALTVFRIDGAADFNFLARAFHKLLINFTWWIDRKDALGDNIFEGGFLGLDNIGPFDRSAALPSGGVLEQSDATAWMAKYCLNMLEIALRLANHDAAYEDIAIKFFEHFALIAAAMNELWDEQDGFFYDRVRKPDGQVVIVRARSYGGASADLRIGPLRRLPMGPAPEFSGTNSLVRRQRAEAQRLHQVLCRRRASGTHLSGRQGAPAAPPREDARRAGVSVALRTAFAVALPSRASAHSRCEWARDAPRL